MSKQWVMVPSDFIDFVRNAPVSSGVCCCGEGMEGHSDPMFCGHAPVDQWDHSLSSWIAEIEAGSESALKAVERRRGPILDNTNLRAAQQKRRQREAAGRLAK